MQAEPTKSDPPKRQRRWYHFSLRLLLVFAFFVLSGWLFSRFQVRASEPMSAGSGELRQVAPPATVEDTSPTKLTAVLNDQKYSGLMRNDLERDMVRYYAFYEDVPRERRDEFWTDKKSYRRLEEILNSENLKDLINDSRLAPFRERRNAQLATMFSIWRGKETISGEMTSGPMTDEAIIERPLRLWQTEGRQQRAFLVSLGPKPSPPRTLSTLQVIHDLLKPSGSLPKPPNDFLILAGPGAKQSARRVTLPNRYQGLAGIAIGLFEDRADFFVVCQDGGLVRIADPRTTDNAEANGDPVGRLDARKLADSADRQDASATFVSVESDKPTNYQIVIEIAGRSQQPKLVARSLSSEKLKELAAGQPQKAATLPQMIWAGCTHSPETRLWAYSTNSNELLGFRVEGRVEFRAILLEPVDYDWLRRTSIAAQLACLELGNLFSNEADVSDGVPLFYRRPHAVVGEVSVEDGGNDLFRRMVRVIEWRGATWVLYPEFRRGNLVLRKIEPHQRGARIPVPSKDRVIDYEPLATDDELLLATREYDERQKKVICRSYEIHGDAWRATADWHEPTDEDAGIVYAMAAESKKPTVYFATTTMPLHFGSHDFSSPSPR